MIDHKWIGKSVYVEWEDSCRICKWVTVKEMVDMDIYRPCRSLGWITAVEHDMVYISPHGDQNQPDELYVGTMLIPTASILSITEIMTVGDPFYRR